MQEQHGTALGGHATDRHSSSFSETDDSAHMSGYHVDKILDWNQSDSSVGTHDEDVPLEEGNVFV
jgi:hypothetical protein